MDILVGTRNQYKLTEMVNFLKGLDEIKIHYLDEIKDQIKVEEDQDSLEGNANKKAIEISKYTDYFVLTSDGGVDIPGLGNKWDILRNQRIVGEDNSDQEKVKVLINLMSELKNEDRKCTYYLALSLAKNGKLIWSFKDIYDTGHIIEKPDNSKIPQYRWMGHLWYYPQYQRVFNQLSEKEINEVRKQGNNIKENLHQYLKKLL